MSSFVNKIANSVTNTTSMFVGRETMNKLTNGLNRSIFIKSKYRDFMKNGNTIQLLSKNSHMSLQICISQNDQSRLILFGNGQIGPEFTASHWVIEIDPKNGHYKFRNGTFSSIKNHFYRVVQIFFFVEILITFLTMIFR